MIVSLYTETPRCQCTCLIFPLNEPTDLPVSKKDRKSVACQKLNSSQARTFVVYPAVCYYGMMTLLLPASYYAPSLFILNPLYWNVFRVCCYIFITFLWISDRYPVMYSSHLGQFLSPDCDDIFPWLKPPFMLIWNPHNSKYGVYCAKAEQYIVVISHIDHNSKKGLSRCTSSKKTEQRTRSM